MAIHNLTEDAATPEIITGSQHWQRIANCFGRAETTSITTDLMARLVDEPVGRRRGHADRVDTPADFVLGDSVDLVGVPAVLLLPD